MNEEGKMKKVDWEDVVGKRVLIYYGFFPFDIFEIRVLSISPNKKYVKIRYIKNNNEKWVRIDDYKIADVLE